MKKVFFSSIFILAAVAATVRFAPIALLHRLPIPVPERIAQYLRLELLPVEMISKPPPKSTLIEAPEPLWRDKASFMMLIGTNVLHTVCKQMSFKL